MRKILTAASPLLLLLTPNLLHAQSYDSKAPIAYLTDMNSGAVLFRKNEDRRIPPASMAKIMTVHVAFDLLAKGEITPETKVRVSDETWRKWNNLGSTMFLAAGSEVSVRDLLHGIVTLSGNDACVVLAEGLAGSEEAYVALMNKKAKELGLENSNFGNTTGWPDEGVTYVTAKDLNILAASTIRKYPKMYKEYYGRKEFSWNGITQPNRNPLFGKVRGADGLKTGHTEEAGYGFAGSAAEGDRRLVMVVAGLESYNGRIDESVRFINWGLRAWKNLPLYKKGATVGAARVQLASTRSIGLVAPSDLALTLPRIADTDGLEMKIIYQGPIKAPIAKGQRIAWLSIKGAEIPEQKLPLVADQAVEQAGFFGRIWSGLLAIFGM